jgi:hypothetical protein
MEWQGVELVFWHWFFGTRFLALGFAALGFLAVSFATLSFATPGFLRHREWCGNERLAAPDRTTRSALPSFRQPKLRLVAGSGS